MRVCQNIHEKMELREKLNLVQKYFEIVYASITKESKGN